jgi:hypothetical protein
LHSPAGACRFPAASPCTPLLHPIQQGRLFTRHQRRFTRFTRPVFPFACGPRMERAPLGFYPELRTPPAQHQQRTSGWGRAIEHEPGTTLSTSADPPIHSSLETCDLVSQMQDETSQNPREEDERAQKAVLGLLLRPSEQRPWSVNEVEREVGEALAVADAIAALRAAGLIHRCGDFVFASRAALSMDRLSL